MRYSDLPYTAIRARAQSGWLAAVEHTVTPRNTPPAWDDADLEIAEPPT